MSKRKNRKSNDGAPKGIAFAWYRREQWGRLLEISVDRESLEDTYDEWKSEAERVAQNLAEEGMVVRKVDVDVEELLEWCKAQDRPVNGEARSQFPLTKVCMEEKDDK